MTDISTLPLRENIENQKAKTSGWPTETRYNQQYYEVLKHYCYHIDFPKMYDYGQKFCDFKLDGEAPHLFIFMMMFMHCVEQGCFDVGLPGVRERNEAARTGGNAAGKGVRKIYVDKNGDVLHSDNQPKKKKVTIPGGLVGIVEMTSSTIHTAFDTKRKLQQASMDEIKMTITNTKKFLEKKKKEILKAIADGANRSIPTARVNQQNNEDDEYMHDGICVFLPPIEVVIEYVQTCNPVWKQKTLRSLYTKQKNNKSSRAREPDQDDDFALLDQQCEEDELASTDEEDGPAHKKPTLVHSGGDDTLDTFSFADTMAKASTTPNDLKLFDELWGDQSDAAMKNPKFKAFIETCSKMYGTGCVGITIHVLVRDKNVDFANIINNQLRRNMQELMLSERSTVIPSMKQQLFCAIGVEYIEGEDEENAVFDRFVNGDEGNQNNNSKMPKVRLPPPKNRNAQTKRVPLQNFQYHEIPRKIEQWGFLRDLYVKDKEFYDNTAALSLDYSYQTLDNCLNANNIFTLENAIANRPNNCQFDSLFCGIFPNTYVDYSTYQPDVGVTVRIPGVHIVVEPESIFPANFVNKTLPHVDSAAYSAVEKMYPSLCTGSDKDALMLHYNAETYPYDPSVVPPPKIGEKYLTLSEIEAAKKWLFGAWGINPLSKHWQQNVPIFSADEDDPSGGQSIQALRSSMNIDLRSNQQDLIKTPRFIQYSHPFELTKELRKFYRALRDTRKMAEIKIRQQYARTRTALPSASELKMVVENQTRMTVDYIALRNVQRNYTSFLMEEHTDEIMGRNGHLMNALEKINEKVLRGLKKAFTGLHDNTRAKRAMYLTYQRNAIDLYDLTARGSHSNISDAALVLVDVERMENLMHPSKRKTLKKYDLNKSNMLNVMGLFLYSYERYFFAFRPGLVFEIWFCGMDATRHEFGTHLDMFIWGDGASSKSHSAKKATDLRCSISTGDDSVAMRSTTQEITSTSEKYNQVDTQGLTNHMMTIDNEMARDKIINPAEGGGANSEWKKQMDDHYTITYAAYLNGSKVEIRCRRKEMIGIHVNIFNYTLAGAEDSAQQRSIQVAITDPTDVDKTIQALQTRQEQSKGTSDDKKAKDYARQHHIIQIGMYHIHMAIKAKIVMTSSFVGMYTILQVCNDVHRKIGIEINPRASKYLLLGGMVYEFLDVFIGEFFSPGGRFYGKNITMDSIRALEPQLFMNTHHVVAAIGTLYKHIMPQGLTEVRQSLWKEFEIKVKTGTRGYRPHFKMNKILNDRTHDNYQNNQGHGPTDHRNISNYSSSDVAIDFRYVHFNGTLGELAGKLVGHMKSGGLGNKEIFTARHVQYVLWNLTKSFIPSKKYKHDDVHPLGKPIQMGTETETIPICEIDERRGGINIAYDFINQSQYDLERCIKESLRSIFDAENQPVYDYMWGFPNDCTPYFETFRLGEGVSAKDITDDTVRKGRRKKMIFANLNYNSQEHLKYLSEESCIDRMTAREINMETAPSILVDMSLDKFGFMKHAKMCYLPFDEKLTKREMMSTLYHFNEILTAASNIAEETIGLGKQEKKIFKEILREIIEPIKEKAKMKNRKEQGIPDAIVKLSVPSENEVLFGDDSPESKAVKRILDLMDDSEDMDLKNEQFMVPVFENEPHCIEEYYTTEGATKPKMIKMTEHWNAINMSFEDYKSDFATPWIREDRFNRNNILCNTGYDIYPNIIRTETETLKQTRQIIETIGKNKKGDGHEKHIIDNDNPQITQDRCIIEASRLFGKRRQVKKVTPPKISFRTPMRLVKPKPKAPPKPKKAPQDVEEIKAPRRRLTNNEMLPSELPPLPDVDALQLFGKKTDTYGSKPPQKRIAPQKTFEFIDILADTSNTGEPIKYVESALKSQVVENTNEEYTPEQWLRLVQKK